MRTVATILDNLGAGKAQANGDLVTAPMVQAARDLRARGFGIRYLLPGQKNPIEEEWTLTSQEPDDYRPGCNLGLMTGRISGDLVCIDLDTPRARELADDFLPATAMVEGRPGKPKSHRYYRVRNIPPELISDAAEGMGGPRIKHFADANKKEILAFLGTGAQAACPPSVHESGEVRSWEGGTPGEPALIDCEMLYSSARLLAFVAGWKPNPKHEYQSDDVIISRAIAYLKEVPGAISGRGGHNQTFNAARAVVRGFDLGPDRGLELLLSHYNAKCEPPWTQRELLHKCVDAATVPYDKPVGWLLEGRNGQTPTPPRATGDPTPRDAILITPDEKQVNDKIIAALANHPDLYKRGNVLVSMLRESCPNDKTIKRAPGGIRIVTLPNVRIREMSTEVAAFKKYVKEAGKLKLVDARPPEHAAAQIAARGGWDGIRHLTGITETPVLCADGQILAKTGWDEASGLLYVPSCDFPAIPAGLTLSDAIDAAKTLLELVQDFPFAAEHHKAAWLAALLTVFARHAIDGPCPLFLFDANVAGSGKSLLCDIIAILATGREMPRVAWRDEDAEVRKTITAIVLAGERHVLWDNIGPDQTLGCPSFDAALAGTSWQDRILGVSQMTAVLPLTTVHLASGNNVALGGDTERRTVLCRLESRLESPEERSGFKIPNLVAHIKDERAKLVVAALTILRAFTLAGRPQAKLAPVGSFESWNDVARNCVFWVTGADPCQGKAELRKANIKKNYLPALLEAWQLLDGGTTDGVTAADAIRAVKKDALLSPEKQKLIPLRALMECWSPKGDVGTPAELGYRLRECRGRVVGGKRLESKENRNGVAAWFVEKV
jgi:hypothetical protein